MLFRFYNKNITEGKSFLIFAAIVAVFFRGYHFFNTELILPGVDESGCLWQPLAFLFQNPLYSLIGSTIFMLVIALLINMMNTQHVLIRKKTLLPVGIAILLLSFIPQQLSMSPAYIGVVCILLAVNHLFSAHNEEISQMIVFKSSFYLALGSLFDPVLLFYFPVLWVCFIRIRSFGLKAFFASLFGIVLLYAPVFSYYFLIERNPARFMHPFEHVISTNWAKIPVLEYGLFNYIILGITVFLIVTILLDNSVNGFKNKIRIRVFLAVLSIISIFSVLCVLLLNISSVLPLYVALATGSLLIGHFFSLTSSKAFSVLFFALLIFVCVLGFCF